MTNVAYHTKVTNIPVANRQIYGNAGQHFAYERRLRLIAGIQ